VNNLQSEKAGPVGIRVVYSRSPFVDCQARRLNDGQKKQIGVILLDAREASVKFLVGGTRCASRVEVDQDKLVVRSKVIGHRGSPDLSTQGAVTW
jgi:hypothetical protein